MIVRTSKILLGHHIAESRINEQCFEITKMDFETPELACVEKNKLKNPEHHIVLQYWI